MSNKSLMSQFGSAMEDVIGNKPSSALSIALMETSAQLSKDLESSLISSGAIASRELLQSINPLPIEIKDGVFTISIEMDSYWKFVNEGVNGTENQRGAPNWGKTPSVGKSFKQSVKEWIAFKGITSLSWQKDGETVTKQLTTPEDFDSAAFVIMRGIKKNGQKATYFVNNVVDDEKYIREIENKIYEAWQ